MSLLVFFLQKWMKDIKEMSKYDFTSEILKVSLCIPLHLARTLILQTCNLDAL